MWHKVCYTCTKLSVAAHTEAGINLSLDFENQQLEEELHKPFIRELKKTVKYTHLLKEIHTEHRIKWYAVNK